MEERFKKYWTTIPYLCSYAFILDLQIRLSKFYDILRLIRKNMNIPYTDTIYHDTEARFYVVYNFYEEEFCNEDMQPPEVKASHYDSPEKMTYPMLSQPGTRQSSTSSRS